MEPVEVYSATNELDAEMLKSLLEDEGIPAIVRSELNRGYGGLTGILGSQVCGNVKVLVKEEDAERALKIISEVSFEPDIPQEDLCEEE